MKKSILNLGKALNKAEQKNVFGGLTELKRKGDVDCWEYYYYAEKCPQHTSNYDGGCWVLEGNCPG